MTSLWRNTIRPRLCTCKYTVHPKNDTLGSRFIAC